MSVTRVVAIDPGYERSALVVFDGAKVLEQLLAPNAEVLERLQWDIGPIGEQVLVVEQVEGFGMPVGKEVLETCWWSGKFDEAWMGPSDRVTRKAVKLHLCGNTRAKDANVRMALLDRFGPGKEKAIGTKASNGPLYGIASDLWSALAVGVTWWDTRRAEFGQAKGAA